jgi:dihydroorotate dehydrogenase (NAD+) catalytic subunit
MRMKNPVFVASGIAGYAVEYAGIVDFNKLGGFISKTVTPEPRKGNTHRRIFEVPGGMINSIGLENPGIDAFLREKLPAMKKMLKVPIVISIAAGDARSYGEIARRLKPGTGVAAIEVNLSCPNTGKDTLPCRNERQTASIIERVRSESGLPVIAKLSPAVFDIVRIAAAAKDAGAAAVSLINTFPAVVAENGNLISGGFSGPALKKTALDLIRKVKKHVEIDIMGVGGIASYADAYEFISAGAAAVAVGSAMFRDPLLPLRIAAEFRRRKNG